MAGAVKIDLNNEFLEDLESSSPGSVNIAELLVNKKTQKGINTIINEKKQYDGFIVSGKAMKKKILSRMGGKSFARIKDIDIRMHGEASNTDITFSRFCAMLMVSYFNKNEKMNSADMTLPSLGNCFKNVENEEFSKMLCMAGPGCQFLPQYFAKLDDERNDKKVGYMILICGMIDWANYLRENIDSTVKLNDFLQDDKYLSSKNTLGAAARNLGKNFEISDGQTAGCASIIAQHDGITRKGVSGERVNKLIKNLLLH